MAIIFNEESTGFLTFAFYDEDGNEVIPNTITWTLMNVDGSEVINGLEEVSVVPAGERIDVTLTGQDLQILEEEASEAAVRRRILIEITYDSTRGTDLAAKQEFMFAVKNLHRVPTPV